MHLEAFKRVSKMPDKGPTQGNNKQIPTLKPHNVFPCRAKDMIGAREWQQDGKKSNVTCTYIDIDALDPLKNFNIRNQTLISNNYLTIYNNNKINKLINVY